MTKRIQTRDRGRPNYLGARRHLWAATALCALLSATVAAGESLKPPAPAESNTDGGASGQGPSGGDADNTGSDEPPIAPPDESPDEPRIEIELSLADAIRLAVRNNLQVRMARLDDAMRQRDIVIARSAFDPLFNLGSTYAKNRDPTVSFLDVGTGTTATGVSTNPSEIESYSTGVSGTWVTGTTYDISMRQIEADRPASRAGGITSLNPVTRTEAYVDVRQPLLQGAWYTINSADIRLAQNNLKLSREEFERILTETVFFVEQAYWDMVFATQNRLAAAKTFDVSTEDLDNALQRLEVGSFSENDVTTVRSQWLSRKVELEAAEQTIETARDVLLTVINYSGLHSLKTAWEMRTSEGNYDRIDVICTTGPEAQTMPAVTRDEALTMAFQFRPEYRQLETQLAGQKIRMQVAKDGLLPNLDVLGRWTQLGLEDSYKDSFSTLGSGKFYDWLVGVELSIPLSRRGARNRYRNSRGVLRQIALQKQDLENEIVVDVNQTLRMLASLGTQLVDLEEQVQLRERLVRDERLKLTVGSATAYEVSLVENDLVMSQTTALRMRADLQIARANFYRAIGRLLVQHKLWMDD